MERMGALDSVFLNIADDGPPVAVGGLLQMEGKAPTLAEFRKYVEGRLPTMERFRQVVKKAPIRVRQPQWAEVDVDINHHVKQIKERPGADLDEVVSHIMEQPLGLDTPLWDMHLVTGYSSTEWAAVIRMSHSIADGQGASILMGSLIDLNLEGTMTLADGIIAMTAATLGKHSGDDENAEDGIKEKIRTRTYNAFEDIGDYVANIPATLETLHRSFHLEKPSELTGHLSNKRKWVHAVYPLHSVKQARKSYKGATINDMVLAAVAVGFRDLIESRGIEVTPDREVRAVMPVSLRKDLRSNNQLSMLPSPLPVGETDLRQQLKTIRKYTKISKASKGPEIFDELFKITSKLVPAGLGGLLFANIGFVGPVLVETIVTNVPGSPVPVYVFGRALKQSSPVIPIASNVRMTIGVTSYMDNLNIGITGDGENATDVDVLLKGIVRGFDDLVALAESDS